MKGLSVANKCDHRGNFLYVLQSMIGKDVLIRTRDGASIKGIFSTATPFESSPATEIVVKMSKVKVHLNICINLHIESNMLLIGRK